jgi:hypothetical protein
MDPEAFAVDLAVIYLKLSSVPAVVNSELLIRIAVVVDCYQLHESIGAIGGFPRRWISAARDRLPWQFERDSVLWICVSSVFGDNRIFEDKTHLAIKSINGEFPTLGLLILQEVAGMFPSPA